MAIASWSKSTFLNDLSSCKAFLNSSKGQKLKQGNPLAWQAVKQYMNAQAAMIPKPPPPTKPLSETFTTNFKDLPPAAQQQVLAQLGINLTPQDFIDKVLLDKASKPAPKPPTAPGQPEGGPPHV